VGRTHSLEARHRENASMRSRTAGTIGILRLHLSCASRATNSALDDSLQGLSRIKDASAARESRFLTGLSAR